MASIGIIGGGAFGTAMACVVRRSGHDVLLWAREPEVVAAINDEGTNRAFLPDIALVPGILATDDLERAAAGRDFILMVVPAQHVREVAMRLRPMLAGGTPVVSCSKGIERDSCRFMPEVLTECLPRAAIAVLSGPSFAREVAAGLPCGVALACADRRLRESLGRAIANPNFCVRVGEDVIGAAVGGVMKNVVAIASGIAAGRRMGENARATIAALGLEEELRLGRAKGARPETFMGLSGIGDLMLTANSLQSRNTSLGVAMGEGRHHADVVSGRRQVTEGYFSVAAVASLAKQFGLDMPITLALDAVLNRGEDLDAAMAGMLARLRHA